jgi:glutathione synthase/RimK-type ligase-like ATP-grasp enzyme
MAIWVVLTGRLTDLDSGSTPHRVITSREYLAQPGLFRGQRPKVINLSRSYSYQSRGYYASLLAEARGHRVIPSVETMIDLSERKLYENALPELEASLNRALSGEMSPAPWTLRIHFGYAADPRFERFGRLLFDWFRAPALEVTVVPGTWAKIQKIAFVPLMKIGPEERVRFMDAMAAYTARQWRDPRQRTPARYSFATLCDPEEELPPSSMASLRHWARIAARLGVEVEPIGRRDLPRLANFDALFIRETTSISNHTYRFARRAVQEGMPVIDDPASMVRCTNKVYLNELMTANGIAVPPTRMIAEEEDFQRAADELGFPLVLKIPDSSFSRGVKKVGSMAEFTTLARAWMEDSDLLIAQKFTPTSFDWRLGVLDGRPLFAVQYLMAKQHWQIVNHRAGRTPVEGGFRTIPLSETPPEVLDVGLRAARCIGSGFYGVDLKETPEGVLVIEVNDNPNLDHGVEDAAEKDSVWIGLTRWFLDRLET